MRWTRIIFAVLVAAVAGFLSFKIGLSYGATQAKRDIYGSLRVSQAMLDLLRHRPKTSEELIKVRCLQSVYWSLDLLPGYEWPDFVVATLPRIERYYDAIWYVAPLGASRFPPILSLNDLVVTPGKIKGHAVVRLKHPVLDPREVERWCLESVDNYLYYVLQDNAYWQERDGQWYLSTRSRVDPNEW